MYYDINKLIMDKHYTIQITNREEREIRKLSAIRDEYEAILRRINERIRILKLELKYGKEVNNNANPNGDSKPSKDICVKGCE